MVLEMPGFAFDQAGAEALARLLRPILEGAQLDEARVPTVLAALTLSAGAVLHRSRLGRNPVAAAMAMGRLLQQALDTNTLPW